MIRPMSFLVRLQVPGMKIMPARTSGFDRFVLLAPAPAVGCASAMATRPQLSVPSPVRDLDPLLDRLRGISLGE
jgi:hypothetical protein